ncbi:hypothetical protein DFP72DRAFT_890338 [Ephemerocybe angulata]|uniref:DNA mismatch repair protein S5 domain-containing protein n=1 Tax=Ephemerocybe angulata TaxID=980116 RepID=A0A8H6I2U3_9AGAR|nr:hypothetical protein DFP72DRAFT_890338 [Tulosesus angulatus]
MSEPAVEPRPIKRLSETLINRIAAGEIIHRPASALKELLENSLDAGSTSIKVTVKDGGLKLLQIQDNGHGIRPLQSISHVARLSVTTKTKKDGHAWKCDGLLVPAKAGQSADPKPSAGNDGTIITIEDLFFNTPTRLSALRSSSDEYARILDVMTKYAIHNSKVAFQCKKAGSGSPELTTPANSTIPQAIKLLYGHTIANDTWKAEVYFTNANYQEKKTNFLLFINHRLVDSPRMKRAVEAVYTSILPKGASPFVYLRTVDVNVHPTKKEVHFLNEDAITDKICSTMQVTLANQATSRTFETQTLLTSHISTIAKPAPSRKGKERAIDVDEDEEDQLVDDQDEETDHLPPSKPKVYAHYKVRTSLNDRTLDSMFPIANPSTQLDAPSQAPSKYRSQPSRTQAPTPTQSAVASDTTSGGSRNIKESECFLTSVQAMRKEVLKAKHRQLSEIFEKHTFVGIVDLDKCLSMIQFSTNLYLVNHAAVAEEFFYQLGLRQFGDMSKLKLEPPPPLRRLIEIAVDAEVTSNSSLTKPQIVEKIFDTLLMRREMLTEYFSFDISEDGDVLSLPLLLRDYIPNLDNLPSLLMRLGPQVDWTSEKECFETFLRELAYFYTPLALIHEEDNPAPDTPPASGGAGDEPDIIDVDHPEQGGNPKQKEKERKEQKEHAEKWQIQHILFPAMRRYLVPPKSLLDRDVVQVASLPDLYKVFERC